MKNFKCGFISALLFFLKNVDKSFLISYNKYRVKDCLIGGNKNDLIKTTVIVKINQKDFYKIF